ncbi:uncharacterized protein LOC111443234 isoform X1 [Cucurbita moschata]|uniref:Uncharacterized protein LOC111443234 isoform X1 n=1 Tax=Cucurbita moschata TaxID=3662 RepID=A0A6J1F8B1_CUCMO|nr:uncharacterized protein LOC111443234 isoform X1 [Cucurbita moschata]
MGTLRIIPNPLSYSIHLQLTPSDLSINPLSHILRSILQMVCLIKGICHGKHYHAAHIAAVLSRAWIAGVERIVVACRIIQVRRDEFCLWSDSNLKQLFLP